MNEKSAEKFEKLSDEQLAKNVKIGGFFHIAAGIFATLMGIASLGAIAVGGFVFFGMILFGPLYIWRGVKMLRQPEPFIEIFRERDTPQNRKKQKKVKIFLIVMSIFAAVIIVVALIGLAILHSQDSENSDEDYYYESSDY